MKSVSSVPKDNNEMKIFSEELVSKAAQECKVADLSRATIGEILLVAQYLEKETGIPFIRMDQGSPGLPVNQKGVEAEKAALDRGVGSQYPAAAMARASPAATAAHALRYFRSYVIFRFLPADMIAQIRKRSITRVLQVEDAQR